MKTLILVVILKYYHVIELHPIRDKDHFMALSQAVRTKTIPHRKTPRILTRPRILRALCEALNYRLCLVQAGAGYGKSTALASLAENSWQEPDTK